MNSDHNKKPLRARLGKLKNAIPFTIIGVLVIAIMLFASSPGMDGVFLKPAAATTYSITMDDNFCMKTLLFSGYTSAIDTTVGSIFRFDSYMSSKTAGFYANPETVKGGSITKIEFEIEWFTDFFTSKGYTSNQTNLETKVNITTWIENPSNVKTYYYPLTQGTLYYDPLDSVGEMTLTTPYVLSAAGTYEFGYEVKYYY